MKYCNTKRQRDYSILLSRLSHLQRKCVLRFSLERPEEMWASHVCWSYFNLGKKCSIRHKKFLEKRPGQIDFAWIKIYWEMGQNRPFGVHPLTEMPATLRGGFSRKTMLYLMWLTFQEAKLIYNPSPLKILTAEIILRPGLIIYRQLTANFLSSGKPVRLSFQHMRCWTG